MLGLIFRLEFCDLMRATLHDSSRLVTPCPISDLHSGDRLRTPAEDVLIRVAVELCWCQWESSKVNMKNECGLGPLNFVTNSAGDVQGTSRENKVYACSSHHKQSNSQPKVCLIPPEGKKRQKKTALRLEQASDTSIVWWPARLHAGVFPIKLGV